MIKKEKSLKKEREMIGYRPDASVKEILDCAAAATNLTMSDLLDEIVKLNSGEAVKKIIENLKIKQEKFFTMLTSGEKPQTLETRATDRSTKEVVSSKKTR